MKIHNIITEKLRDIEEHVKGGLDSYYQLTKAKRLAADDGHDYDKLPEYHRGADQPHKEKYLALAAEVSESDLEEVSDFKKRELEYELRDEEPKSVPSKRRPYRTPQEKIRDAKKRYSKAVGVMKGNTDEGIEEAEGDKCEICNGRGKIDYHSEDGPSKCQKCNGKGVQAWKPEPVNWGNAKVKEDDLNDLRKRAGLEVRAVSEESLHEESFDCDDKFFETYGWLDADTLEEAEYQGRKVKLNKPMQGDVKKFKVYVKDPKTGNTKKVNFGHGGSSVKGKAMKIRKNNPKARKSFRARHNCDSPGPKTKARYWSCRKW